MKDPGVNLGRLGRALRSRGTRYGGAHGRHCLSARHLEERQRVLLGERDQCGGKSADQRVGRSRVSALELAATRNDAESSVFTLKGADERLLREVGRERYRQGRSQRGRASSTFECREPISELLVDLESEKKERPHLVGIGHLSARL